MKRRYLRNGIAQLIACITVTIALAVAFDALLSILYGGFVEYLPNYMMYVAIITINCYVLHRYTKGE